MGEVKKKPPTHIFDGFMHRPYDEERDGYMMELFNENELPSVQMAKDILYLFDQCNALIKDNWKLRQRLENK